jgi:hypothetical protein
VNKVYAHGIAKNFKVIKTANGLTGRPFVSAKQYAANTKRDRGSAYTSNFTSTGSGRLSGAMTSPRENRDAAKR